MKQSDAISRLKALADPTRQRVLALLDREELTVGEITDVLGMAQSRVSGHLGVLREAGLVRDRRQGTSAFYSLAPGEALATWEAVRETVPDPDPAGRDRRRLSRVLVRRRERSREFFDRVAAAGGERSESLGHHAGVFALAGLVPRRMTVLDLGTGTGGLLPLLVGSVETVVAIDMSRGMLHRARDRMNAEGRGVSLVRADVERLPVPDASVDGVVANMVMHHLAHPEALLTEMARVLGPGGRGVIVDFEAHGETWLSEEEGHRWMGFDPAQLGGWCLDAGLTVPDFQRVPTPDTGRWSRLQVFTARFSRGHASRTGGRQDSRTAPVGAG